MNDSQWLYCDTSGAQKGPIPTNVLLRLLEKGIGISPETLVWKAGMAAWQRIGDVDEFREVCAFLSKQWYYLDANNMQKGPVLSRLIVHKLREGELDGLTMLFASGMKEWTRLSDIPDLKKVAQNIVEEEARASSLLSSIGEDDQTFNSEIFTNGIPKLETCVSSTSNADGAKEFVNDEGIRFMWDTDANEWIEAEESDGLEDEAGLDKATSEDNTDTTDTTAEFFSSLGSQSNPATSDSGIDMKAEKRKRNKKKKKNTEWNATSKLWIYVSNLPLDVTVEEVKAHFSKVGLIALNPVDQLPKIKLYVDDAGNPKGDCSICYNAETSADMALDVLDGGYIRPSTKPLSVTRAHFQKRQLPNDIGDGPQPRKKPTLTQAQIKVSQNAMAQALAWNEDDDVGVSKSRALKIVAIENMFDPMEVDVKYQGDDSAFFEELEKDVALEGEKCGEIDKITIFSRNPLGAIIIKFCTSYAAQECVRIFDGRMYAGRKVRCKFWDGVTDYSSMSVPVLECRDGKYQSINKPDAEDTRLEEFGDWLEKEQDDLPEEFRLREE